MLCILFLVRAADLRRGTASLGGLRAEGPAPLRAGPAAPTSFASRSEKLHFFRCAKKCTAPTPAVSGAEASPNQGAGEPWPYSELVGARPRLYRNRFLQVNSKSYISTRRAEKEEEEEVLNNHSAFCSVRSTRLHTSASLQSRHLQNFA